MTASSDVGRRLDHVQVLALLGRQVGVQGQLGHADDAVHRRADLVAHVGQELALGPVGRLGGLPGLAQLLLGLLALGDVVDHAEQDRPAGEVHGREGRLAGEQLAVESAGPPIESAVSILASDRVVAQPLQGRAATIGLEFGRQVGRVDPDHVRLVGAAIHPQGLVVAVDDAVALVEQDVGVGRLLEEHPEGILGRFSLGDVLGGSEDQDRPTRIVAAEDELARASQRHEPSACLMRNSDLHQAPVRGIRVTLPGAGPFDPGRCPRGGSAAQAPRTPSR